MLNPAPLLERISTTLLTFEKPWVEWITSLWRYVQHAPMYGDGAPEGRVTATPGRLYCRIDAAAGPRLFQKDSGTGNTGWTAK